MSRVVDRSSVRVLGSATRVAYIALLLWWLLASACQAEEPVPFPQATNDSIGLDRHMEVLVDRTRMLSLGEVLRGPPAQRFQRSPNGLSLGYTRNAAWVRLAIRGTRSEQMAMLWLTPAFVDLVDVYVAQDRPGLTPADFAHTALGDHRPLPADGRSALGYGIPLSVEPDKTTLIYMRVASVDSSLNLSVALYPRTNHTKHVTITSLASGLWFGGMIVLLLIQLVFYFYRRKMTNFLMALSTFGAMLVYVGNLGVSRMLLFPLGGIGNDLFTASSVWFGMFASSLATRSILDLPNQAPWLSKIYLFSAAMGLVGIGFALCHRAILFAPTGATLGTYESADEEDFELDRVAIMGRLDGRWFVAVSIVDGDGNAHGLMGRRHFRSERAAREAFAVTH